MCSASLCQPVSLGRAGSPSRVSLGSLGSSLASQSLSFSPCDTQGVGPRARECCLCRRTQEPCIRHTSHVTRRWAAVRLCALLDADAQLRKQAGGAALPFPGVSGSRSLLTPPLPAPLPPATSPALSLVPSTPSPVLEPGPHSVVCKGEEEGSIGLPAVPGRAEGHPARRPLCQASPARPEPRRERKTQRWMAPSAWGVFR